MLTIQRLSNCTRSALTPKHALSITPTLLFETGGVDADGGGFGAGGGRCRTQRNAQKRILSWMGGFDAARAHAARAQACDPQRRAIMLLLRK